MKKTATLYFIIISFLFISCNEKNSTISKHPISKINKIEVIDFYGTHRCVTCKAIESNAKYTVDTYFSNEQKKGLVIFKSINVDDSKNYQIAKDFEATGTALFLNVLKNGKETHMNLTDFGFSKGRNKEEFSNALKLRIAHELKNL